MTTAKHKGVKAVLFDKDGTLVDFNGTWHALYEKLALEVTGGDTAEAQRLLVEGGFNAATGSFAAGSELAAGTTPGIVRLWLPDARHARAIAHSCRTCSLGGWGPAVSASDRRPDLVL